MINLKARVLLTVFVTAILAARTYAQAPPGPVTSPGASAAPGKGAPPPDKVVLKVGNEQVTQAEFEALIGTLNPQMQQSVATQGHRSIGEQYALLFVLSQQALSEHLEVSPEVQRRLALQRLQLLANTEYASLTRRAQPKPEEISQYYSTHAAEFEEVQARKVFIRKKPEGAKEGTPGLDPPEAKARAEAIRKALASGTDAKKVGEEFKGSRDVVIDAEPRAVRRGQWPAATEKAAFTLKDGELSEPEDTPQSISFIQVVKHRSRELKEVTQQIERKLQQQKMEAALDELKKKAAIWMDEEYFKPPQPAAAGAPPATAQPPKP